MDFAQVSTQLSFLDAASATLSDASPETAAYLRSRYTTLARESVAKPDESRREHICHGCGHQLIPGRDGTAMRLVTSSKYNGTKALQKKEPRGSARKGRRTATGLRKPSSKPSKTITCGSCRKYTTITLPTGKSRLKVRKAGEGTLPTVTSSSSSHAAKEPVNLPQKLSNANSKKRAKSRKTGLQAILDQNSNDASRFEGLSLSMFLKKA